MATYATIGDLKPRIGGRELTSTSNPSTDDVEKWIDAAESMVVATLLAGNITAPTDVAGDGYKIIGEWVMLYAVGNYRSTMAAAGGDGDNEDGERELEDFKELLKDIRGDAPYYAALLTGGSSAAAQSRIRGSTNIEAQFTRDEQW